MRTSEALLHRKNAIKMLRSAGIILTPTEKKSLEIADFGLGDFRSVGLAIVTYVNNGLYCAKELILLPGQICPEHRHPPISRSNPGKTETFRCRKGLVTLYTKGRPSSKSPIPLPASHARWLVVRKKLVLRPGEQFTLPRNTLHWFQAGPSGAVVSEFSSPSLDERDVFTDPRIRRIPEITAD